MNKKQKQHQMIVPGNGLAVNVVGTEKHDIAIAIKTWKRKVKTAGVLEITRDRKEHIKNCVTKRQEKNKAIYFQRIQDLRDKN
jgi:hypothetical protein